MSGGRYVRAPSYQSEPEESDEEANVMLDDASDSVREDGNQLEMDESQTGSPSGDEGDGEKSLAEDDDEEERNATEIDSSSTVNVSAEPALTQNVNPDYNQRMQQMENTLNQVVKALASKQPIGGTYEILPEDDHSWNTSNVNVGASTSSTNVRWDNIQPFPYNVPANRMWEEWCRFVDRFQIAASISNINDPVKRAQILFLPMGEKLQRIVRAARLRPSLEEPNCYTAFVKNVEGYLRSMVDATAEHEAFTNLKQEPNEMTMAFYSRLMEKARLCGYNSADQERFIRAQLLKGMRNKELVKTARTFGYDTLFIVQAASREEVYMAESSQPEPTQALAVNRNIPNTLGNKQQWKRKQETPTDRWMPYKKRETDESRNRGLGRRSRCSKCNRLFHKFGSCPATNSNCNTCGMRGHFAIVCRKRDANQLQFGRNQEPEWTDDGDDAKVKPQID